jgi:non-specific serine/threonine protein kinase
MQLQPPADIARFDWRAALGPSIVLDDATPAVADPTTALLTTQPAPPAKTMAQTTRVRERTVNTGRSNKSRRSSRDPSKSRESRVPVAVPAKPGALPWVLGGLAALLLSVGTYWVLKPSKPTTPDAVGGAQMTTEQLVSAPVAASVPAPVVEVAPPVSEPATRSIAAPAKIAAASAPTAAAPATPRVPKIEPRATAPVPAPVAVPAPSPTLCADATVLTRTMCIYRECQKPEHVQLPVCIADRKHWEEQNRSKNGF